MTTATTTAPPPEWRVDLADCPPDSIPDALEFCLRYAVLAPSTHNAQPWRFRLDGSSVDVFLDCRRGLPVTDPEDREGIISVGAAVMNLRVALAQIGLGCRRQPWPDPVDPECLVRVTADDTVAADRSLTPLFDAIVRRHTNRAAFRPDEVPPGVLTALRAAATVEGADLHVATDYVSRHTVAEVVADADRRQMSDVTFRRELATWLRVSHHARDGIQGYSMPDHELLSIATPVIVRTFDLGSGRAAHDAEIASFSPALALLTTPGDERTDWLNAGQALERVLLRATASGVDVGFLDQPIEVEDLRARTAGVFETADVPQLLLRLGYGPPPVPQRRRPVDEVLV